MRDQFVTLPLEEIVVGEPLPGGLYLHIDFKFILFRSQGDILDGPSYDRLQAKKMKSLFVQTKDREAFKAAAAALRGEVPPPRNAEEKAVMDMRSEMKRAMGSLFLEGDPQQGITNVVGAAKNLALAVMKLAYAAPLLTQLQGAPRGVMDHSINVSVLASFLALRLGFSHQRVLEMICAGGLLHDIGKTVLPIGDNDSPEETDRKRLGHPEAGAKLIASRTDVPAEVGVIVLQHHEYYDGSGFPRGIKGKELLDASQIVGMANLFDDLVTQARGTLVERQHQAIVQIEQVLLPRLDPGKAPQMLRILKQGI